MPTVDDMGMREWIEEGRFVASLSGYALTGDTLHHRSSTWSVAGMRAEVEDGSIGLATPRVTSDASTAPGDPPRGLPTHVVVRITTATGELIVIDAPAKRVRQAHDLALRVNRASAYFTERQRSAQDPARIR